MLKKKPVTYFLVVLSLIFTFSFGYKLTESRLFFLIANNEQRPSDKPAPIPPYAQLLMYSLLIIGVDTGLLFSKKWYENEENKYLLETKNAEMQLEMLRNQVSPHFFMNTLNNIYALIDCDTPKAKEAVMKLSKLMRYMLYENEHKKVKISKEFEFIKSYIDLMKLRYAENVSILLHLPDEMNEVEIPPMLFICYIENAFKHGVSYQQESFITIQFEQLEDRLHFMATNSKQPETEKLLTGGLGLINNENRLKLLYADHYMLSITSTDRIYNVSLEIPLL
ncbi:MAG: histidine kinase, partial [Bacteroidia bacterium]|nr:histidine kinase [Bacteroidia bacterium]